VYLNYRQTFVIVTALSSWTKSLGFSTCVTRKTKQQISTQDLIFSYYPPFQLGILIQMKEIFGIDMVKTYIWMEYCFIASSLIVEKETKSTLLLSFNSQTFRGLFQDLFSHLFFFFNEYIDVR
jgi:hypothetical protein